MSDEKSTSPLAGEVGAPAPGGGLPASVWRRRWALIKWSLLFCAAAIVAAMAYAIMTGKDNALIREICLGLVAYAVGVVGAYVFGATWDDKSFRDALVRLRRPDEQS